MCDTADMGIKYTREAKKPAPVGRPASGKERIAIRLDPAVIEKFRATGKGWQARINEALRRAVL